jgi:hypothetical protein
MAVFIASSDLKKKYAHDLLLYDLKFQERLIAAAPVLE